MIDPNIWVPELVEKVRAAFGGRLLFLGLQGSYRRGEATPDSDIDIVIVLDGLCTADMDRYKAILRTMPEGDKACGFLCGREELTHWPAYELFQLAQETRAYAGRLEALLPPVGAEDIDASVRIGAANLYHEACHRYLYDGPETPANAEALKGAYKAAFFLLQMTHYRDTGVYASTKEDLLPRLSGDDRRLLEVCRDWDALRDDRAAQPGPYYTRLIDWSSRVLRSL